MKKGFIRVAAAVPKVRTADVSYNTEKIISLMEEAYEKKVRILVFPEMCLTGRMLGDLVRQRTLLDAAGEGLKEILSESRFKDMLIFVGLPFVCGNALYEVTAAVKDGNLLAMIPRHRLDPAGQDSRYFAPGPFQAQMISTGPETADETGHSMEGMFGEILFGRHIVLHCTNVEGLDLSVLYGDELLSGEGWPEELRGCGADVLICPSAFPATCTGTAERRALSEAVSGLTRTAIVLAGAGEGESTTDSVFSGECSILECGETLADGGLFCQGLLISEIDTHVLAQERILNPSPTVICEPSGNSAAGGWGAAAEVPFRFLDLTEEETLRRPSRTPFLPENKKERDSVLSNAFEIQARGLKKRMEHIHSTRAVLGLSGGLDSTLALLVVRRTFELMGADPAGILAVTMPAFGTSKRTYDNALILARETGAELKEINIGESCMLHFRDIGHDPKVHNAAYENAQARERTQVLMDIANDIGGLVIGTGDMSEAALGWCTYNGDQMSMYNVNGGVPKTMVRAIAGWYAENRAGQQLKEALLDVIDTPVSPELLPADEKGQIAQKTEDIVGPYELHDFFLWYLLRYSFGPEKILQLACPAFEGQFAPEEIKKWLCIFFKRFFSSQFKRSACVDGPAVLDISLSPRTGLRMPSDAVSALWMQEAEQL